MKIEDILPYFPPFVTIDAFKDEICASLEDYNKRIEQLKEEMDEYTSNAETIRHDIRDLRNRSAVVSGYQSCEICLQPLLERAFYLFPCGHGMHADCLTNEKVRHLDDTGRAQVAALQRTIAAGATGTAGAGSSGAGGSGGDGGTGGTGMDFGIGGISERELCQRELDEIVGEQCILCGDQMIASVVEPFVRENAEESEWKL